MFIAGNPGGRLEVVTFIAVGKPLYDLHVKVFEEFLGRVQFANLKSPRRTGEQVGSTATRAGGSDARALAGKWTSGGNYREDKFARDAEGYSSYFSANSTIYFYADGAFKHVFQTSYYSPLAGSVSGEQTITGTFQVRGNMLVRTFRDVDKGIQTERLALRILSRDKIVIDNRIFIRVAED